MNRHLANVDKDDLVFYGGIGVLLFILYKGGIGAAMQSLSTTLVRGAADAAGGVATGAVDAIGQSAGLPALSNLTSDPFVARYIADHPLGGWLSASKWSTASALLAASRLEPYTGHAPPLGSEIEANFPSVSPEGAW